MKWHERLSGSLLKAIERSGRMRALTVLRRMDPKSLREAGFSPELIQQGVGAWPWRADTIEAPPSSNVESETARHACENPAESAIARNDLLEDRKKCRVDDNDVAA